jgi:hypothetical protein
VKRRIASAQRGDPTELDAAVKRIKREAVAFTDALQAQQGIFLHSETLLPRLIFFHRFLSFHFLGNGGKVDSELSVFVQELLSHLEAQNKSAMELNHLRSVSLFPRITFPVLHLFP